MPNGDPMVGSDSGSTDDTDDGYLLLPGGNYFRDLSPGGEGDRLIAVCDYLRQHGRCGICRNPLQPPDESIEPTILVTLVLLPYVAMWRRPVVRLQERDGSIGPPQAVGAVCGSCTTAVPVQEIHWEVNEAVEIISTSSGGGAGPGEPVDHRYHGVDDLEQLYSQAF